MQTLSGVVASVFEALGREPPKTVPTPLEAKPYPGEWSVDYILATPGVNVLDAGLAFDEPSLEDETLYPSDHYGLFAVIDI